MKKPTSLNTGFTIVELLIVIVVIGILAAITIVAYSGIQNKAKASVLKNDLSQASRQLELLRVDNASSNYVADLAAANLKVGSDTHLQYTVDNSTNPPTFCLTATSLALFGTAFHVDQTGAVQDGACAGQSATGYTNLLANPGGETAATTTVLRTNWTKDPAAAGSISNFGSIGPSPPPATTTIASDRAHSGSTSLRREATGSGQIAAVALVTPGSLRLNAGERLVWSFWVYSTKAGSLTPYAEGAKVADGSYTGFNGGSAVAIPANNWVLVTGSGTAVQDTYVSQAGGYNLSVVSGDVLWSDDFIIEQYASLGSYFDGSTASTGDFAFNWTGAANSSSSQQTAIGVSNYSGNASYNYPAVFQSSTWSATGSKSVGMINRGAHNDQFFNLDSTSSVLQPNKTYTLMARLKTTKTISDPNQLRLRINISGVGDKSFMPSLTGPAGEYDFRVTFDTNGMNGGVNFFRLMNTINDPGLLTYWDNLMLVEGNYSGPYF